MGENYPKPDQNRTNTFVKDRGTPIEKVTVQVIRGGKTSIEKSVKATLAVGRAIEKTPPPAKPKA